MKTRIRYWAHGICDEASHILRVSRIQPDAAGLPLPSRAQGEQGKQDGGAVSLAVRFDSGRNQDGELVK